MFCSDGVAEVIDVRILPYFGVSFALSSSTNGSVRMWWPFLIKYGALVAECEFKWFFCGGLWFHFRLDVETLLHLDDGESVTACHGMTLSAPMIPLFDELKVSFSLQFDATVASLDPLAAKLPKLNSALYRKNSQFVRGWNVNFRLCLKKSPRSKQTVIAEHGRCYGRTRCCLCGRILICGADGVVAAQREHNTLGRRAKLHGTVTCLHVQQWVHRAEGSIRHRFLQTSIEAVLSLVVASVGPSLDLQKFDASPFAWKTTGRPPKAVFLEFLPVRKSGYVFSNKFRE
ncbi:unnamed protein product [Calypogeia fissa]